MARNEAIYPSRTISFSMKWVASYLGVDCFAASRLAMTGGLPWQGTKPSASVVPAAFP